MTTAQVELVLRRETEKVALDLKEYVAYIRSWCGCDHSGDKCLMLNIMLRGPFDLKPWNKEDIKRFGDVMQRVREELAKLARTVAQVTGKNWCYRHYSSVHQLTDHAGSVDDPKWKPPTPLTKEELEEIEGPLTLADVIGELKGLRKRVEELERRPHAGGVD